MNLDFDTFTTLANHCVEGSSTKKVSIIFPITNFNILLMRYLDLSIYRPHIFINPGNS